jgi:PleD family two-component response regulator
MPRPSPDRDFFQARSRLGKKTKPFTGGSPFLGCSQTVHSNSLAQSDCENPGGTREQGIKLTRPTHHNVTVCLVDDDPSVLKATGRLLSSAGWKTEPFTDPVVFLRYAEASHPPLVVLDIWMPVMSGLELQAKLRSVSPSTQVVVLTSKDDPSVRTKALDAGAAAFFLKPPPNDEFLERLESICQSLNGSN